MSDADDVEETIDIHQYVQQRMDEAGIDPQQNPHQTREFINQAAGSYLIQIDTEDLQDYEYHYISIVRIEDLVGSAQEKFHEEVDRYVTEIGEVSDMPDEELLELAESAGRFTIGNNVTLSYSMAYELVEDLMRRLIPEILRDDVEDGAGLVLVSQLGSYSGKADVLRACRVIEEDTRDDIRHIKDVRDALVHDVTERYSLSMLDDLNDINRVQEAVNVLYEKVYDMPAYQYVDGEA